MTTANFAFTTNAFAIISRALLEVRFSDTDFLQNGDEASSEAAMSVLLLNEAESDAYQENPGIGRTSGSVSLTALAGSFPLPAAVWRADIYRIVYVNANSIDNGTEIQLVPNTAESVLSGYALNDSIATVPRFAWLSDDKSTIELSDKVELNTTLQVYYRSKAGQFTASDLGSSSTVYSVFPNDFMQAVAYRLAAKYASILDLPEKESIMLAKAKMVDTQITEALTDIPALSKQRTLTDAPYFPNARAGNRGSGIGITRRGYN